MKAAKQLIFCAATSKGYALLHSLVACIFSCFLASSGSVMAQTGATNAQAKTPPLYEQTYQTTLINEQKKYEAALNACDAKIASAQCKRQARLSKNQADHAAKLTRAQARTAANQTELAQKKAHANARSAPLRKPETGVAKKPMSNKAAPPKDKHTGGAMSAQPNAQAKKTHAEKQAKVAQNVAKANTQAKTKAAQREAKNQKRREAGYPVDSKPAP